MQQTRLDNQGHVRNTIVYWRILAFRLVSVKKEEVAPNQTPDEREKLSRREFSVVALKLSVHRFQIPPIMF